MKPTDELIQTIKGCIMLLQCRAREHRSIARRSNKYHVQQRNIGRADGVEIAIRILERHRKEKIRNGKA